MYLVIKKCVTAVKVSNFSGHYLRNRSTLNIGVLGFIGIVQHKEHSPEVLSIPPGTPCISIRHIEESMYTPSTQCDVLSQEKHTEITSTPAWSTPFHSPDTLDYRTHSAAARTVSSRSVLI